MITEETNNVMLEPRNINCTNQTRPDIIINDTIEIADGNFSKVMIDTVITNVYNNLNIQNIEQNNIKIFNAGCIAEKRKYDVYKNKFEEKRKNGYQFIPFVIENYGGVSKNMKIILKYFLKKKATRLKMNSSVVMYNFYNSLSIKFQALMYETIIDHYRLF
jgi:hypothetical protein